MKCPRLGVRRVLNKNVSAFHFLKIFLWERIYCVVFFYLFCLINNSYFYMQALNLMTFLDHTSKCHELFSQKGRGRLFFILGPDNLTCYIVIKEFSCFQLIEQMNTIICCLFPQEYLVEKYSVKKFPSIILVHRRGTFQELSRYKFFHH